MLRKGSLTGLVVWYFWCWKPDFPNRLLVLYQVINFGQLLLVCPFQGGIAIVTLIIGTLNPKGYIQGDFS